LVWDTEVDVLCLGAGMGGLATAIAAAEAGADVIVATAGARLSPEPSTLTANPDGWLPVVGDDETDRYLASVVDGFSASAEPFFGAVPTRVAAERPTGTRTVETFVGARVADWGSDCLRSITGALFSTVRGWDVTEMHDADGRSILVAPVGDIRGQSGSTARDLHRSLISEAEARDIEATLRSPLQRLVFEGGLVVGAVLGGPGQEWAIGTRHAVVLAPDAGWASDAAVTPATGESQLCLVSTAGSRFARVELVGPP
jgi:choline dehydrogenase-like flavoprotein